MKTEFDFLLEDLKKWNLNHSDEPLTTYGLEDAMKRAKKRYEDYQRIQNRNPIRTVKN